LTLSIFPFVSQHPEPNNIINPSTGNKLFFICLKLKILD
jgi:hypothetical protein